MDEHPYIDLIERHSAAIDKVCRQFCSSAEDRADLRQEVLLNLWRGWKRYKPEYRPITWVYRVALNTAITYRRRQRRQVPTVALEVFDVPNDEEAVAQVEHLKELLAQLPVADQRVMGLYLDGWSAAEMARLLGTTPSAVGTRLGRIKQKIRNLDER